MCQLLCLYVVDILKDYAGDNFNEAGAPRLIAANLVFFAISFFTIYVVFGTRKHIALPEQKNRILLC